MAKHPAEIVLSAPQPAIPIYLPAGESDANHTFIDDGSEAGIRKFVERANSGHSAAQAVVSYMYLNKAFADENYLERAIDWGRKSASQDNSFGNWVLAWGLFESGDVRGGISSLVKSAEAQFSPAIFDLGSFCFYGVVLPKNQELGLMLLRRAALMGHNNARLMIESAYKLGVFGKARMVLMTFVQPILKALRAIRWLFSSRKFSEDHLVYVRRIHVENDLRRKLRGESIDDDLEELLEEKIRAIRS